jgi:hypothetical protein
MQEVLPRIERFPVYTVSIKVAAYWSVCCSSGLLVFMELFQMKSIWRMIWPKKYRPLRIVPVDIEVSVLPTYHPMHPIPKELPGLLLELRPTLRL